MVKQIVKTDNNKYTWDLDAILEGETLEDLKNKYFLKQEEIVSIYKNEPFQSEDKFRTFCKVEIELGILSNRISNYISNHSNADLSDNSWFLIQQELGVKSIPVMQAFSSFEDDVIKNKEKILSYLEKPEFVKYLRLYQDIFDSEKHKLTPEIKKFCATYAPVSDAQYSIFTLLLDKELVVEDALDSKNKKHKIENRSQYIKYLKESDRTLRKNVYINWIKAINNHRSSLARLMYFNFAKLNIDAKNRNFEKGYFEEVMFEDELPLDFVPKLYERIEETAPLVKKYGKINREILKKNYSLDKVRPWDVMLPLFNEKEHYTIEEAQSIVIEALLPLGEQYQAQLKEAFNNRWIDWLPRKNKLSGAYCIGGCYGLKNKYILLNYNNKFDDISTLAHELGHAMHAVEFCKHQDIYADCSIFTAEIPSILNEVLLNYHFLSIYKKEKNNKKLLEIYDNLISGFIGSTTSQIIYSSWEYEMNQIILQGQAIDADLAEKIYYEKECKYLAKKPKKTLKELKKKSLSKILTVPHFYAGNFYVYKYAIGKVVAVAFAEKLVNSTNKEEREQSLKNLYDFLSSGSSKKNLDTINLLGIFLEKEDVWELVKKALKNWVSQYEKLFKEINK